MPLAPSPTCSLTSPPASREFSFKGGKILFAEFVEFPRAQWEKAVCHSSGCKREGTSEGEREGGRRGGERGLCRAHVSYATHTHSPTHTLSHTFSSSQCPPRSKKLQLVALLAAPWVTLNQVGREGDCGRGKGKPAPSFSPPFALSWHILVIFNLCTKWSRIPNLNFG